jgi:diguanylate cyclase (GGDEF)-like protein/PAS domain S-box-containing protein
MLENLTTILAPSGLPSIYSTPRILVVDDEPLLRNSTQQILSIPSYEIHSAGGGREAVARLSQQHYDLVLLDLFMPDYDGHQVMQFILQSDIDTSVIVVSGDTSIDAAISSLRSGAYDFLRKPYEPEELLKRVQNVLQKRRLEQQNEQIANQLQHSETWYRYIVNNSPDLIYTLDNQGRFTFLNDRAESLLGFSKEELLGQHYSNVIHPEDLDRVSYVFDERRTSERASRNVELRLKCKDCDRGPRLYQAQFLDMELSSMGIYEGTDPIFLGKYIGTYGVLKDVSERKKAEETIHYQAYHDLLTGLPNRILFKDRLNLAIAQTRRNSQMLAVMFLDLDRFKVVNDTLGHVVGDELLLNVASRLRGCLREGDTLARLGGDEFTLLLPQINQREDAVKIAHKILTALEQPFHIDDHELFASVSIGIARFPNDGETIDSLIKHADIAMYHAKASGRNNYQFYSQAMNVSFSGRLSLESSMRKALERNEFVVHYQPQVNIESNKIVGMEALIRWQHPTRGLLPPSEFIPLAEETGLVVSIGEWVLRTACADVRAWQDAGLPRVRLAINFSAQQVEQPQFTETILNILEETGLDSGVLEVEITESVIMKDVENTISKLIKLSGFGVKIAIDDFGTGYSSLSYLKKFPIHTIKIDQSFVRDISKDPSGTSIVTAIIAMAKGLKLNLVAEGVETERQLAFLRGLECNEMQGFLFSWPLTVEEATKLLAEQTGRTHSAMQANAQLQGGSGAGS